jgi:hypothetical protein
MHQLKSGYPLLLKQITKHKYKTRPDWGLSYSIINNLRMKDILTLIVVNNTDSLAHSRLKSPQDIR